MSIPREHLSTLALHAARLIGRALVRAVEHGEDLDARADMLVAAPAMLVVLPLAGIGLYWTQLWTPVLLVILVLATIESLPWVLEWFHDRLHLGDITWRRSLTGSAAGAPTSSAGPSSPRSRCSWGCSAGPGTRA